MSYLILLTQQSFLALGHIMAEISSIKKNEWPSKFKDFESVFIGFKKQRIESKPQVAHIIPKTEIKGFLGTLTGYRNMVDANLNAAKIDSNRSELRNSQEILEALRIEINPQLAEQGFSLGI